MSDLEFLRYVTSFSISTEELKELKELAVLRWEYKPWPPFLEFKPLAQSDRWLYEFILTRGLYCV